MDLLNEVMKNYLKEKGINGNSKVSGTDVAKLLYNFTSEQLILHGVGSCNGKKDENIENEYILIDGKDGLWDVYDKKGCLGMGLNNEEVNRLTQK